MQLYLDQEIEAGRICGPFSSPPFSVFRTSPIGAIPKPGTHEVRVIHHLSFPSGESVNDLIPDDNATVQYTTVRDVARTLARLGRGALIAKVDVRKAYRIVPVSPSDYPVLGFTWEGEFYFDTVLAMGLRSACATFQRISNLLVVILRQIRPHALVHNLLDDFIFFGTPGTLECFGHYQAFLELSRVINLPLNLSKLVPPSTCVTVFGLEFDTVAMVIRLPTQKRLRMLQRITEFQSQPVASKHDIQSLAGLLNYAVVVIPAGGVFLNRLYRLACHCQDTVRRVPADTLKDLHVWSLFLEHFNGVSSLLPRVPLANFRLSSDAAGACGFGLIFGSQWSFGEWDRQSKSWSITPKELMSKRYGQTLWPNGVP